MALDKDYTRLGLFLILAAILITGTVLFFVQRARNRPSIELVTYTDQNVSGLRIDSTVRFKGVTIGRVQNVILDADSRLVQVNFEVFLDQLTGFTERNKPRPDVRVYTMGNPITGEAYLLIDTPPNPPPPMVLDFESSRPYVPSMPSPLAEIRDRLPDLIERGLALVDTAEQIIARLPATLDKSDAFFTNADRILVESNIPKLSADVIDATDELHQLLGEDGTLNTFLESTQVAVEQSDLPATTEALRKGLADARESLDRASLAADDLRRMLPAIRAAVEQFHALALLFEEETEAILYEPRRQETKQ